MNKERDKVKLIECKSCGKLVDEEDLCDDGLCIDCYSSMFEEEF